MYIEIGRKRANKSYPFLLDEGSLPSFMNKVIGKFNPFWQSLNEFSSLTKMYRENPVLFSVLNIKANYFANVQISVRDIKSGKIYKKDRLFEERIIPPNVKKMMELMYDPNPLQSKTEFLRTNSIYYDLYANSYLYGNFSSFREYNIETIDTIKCLWPEKMKPKLTGSFLSARKETDVIESWEFTGIKGAKQQINPSEILHRKDVNIDSSVEEDVILGKPRAIPLYRPLTNIQIAYESLNVIGQERGMRAIISSAKESTQAGSLPFTPNDEKNLRDEMKDYGTLEGQSQFKFSRQPVNVVQLDQDIRKLGFQEQIASDAMVVCYAFQVSELLFKLRFAGATYVNLGEAERQMYQNTTIPFAQDWIEDINVWLACREFGYEYVISFDHIKVLQENEKERAIINRNNSVTMRDLFMGGGCTFNEWRNSLGLDPDNNGYGDKYIFQLPEEVIMAITGRNLVNAQNDLKNQANDNPDAK